MFRRCFACVVW